MMPAKMPTTILMVMPIKKLLSEIVIGKPTGPDKTNVSRNTSSIPIKPPNKQRITDSTKNSERIAVDVAPIAFLTPINVVLSLTETNMILAMPKLPTTKENKPINQPTNQPNQ